MYSLSMTTPAMWALRFCIRHFLMQKAKSMLLSGSSVSEVSEALGFEYPQNLTRMFKKEFGLAPSRIRK